MEEAVYITQVEDYFLEVHFLMTACGVVCVCFAYSGDKTGDAVCVCVVGIFSVTWMTRIVTAAGVTSLFQQLSGFVFPLLFPAGLPLLIRLDKQKKLRCLQISW